MTCPSCGCPFIRAQVTSTADAHRPWQDADGTWYDGPAREHIRNTCKACGWTHEIHKRRGKVVDAPKTRA